MKKLKVSKGVAVAVVWLTYDLLESFCIDLCGGGWTEKQTKDALLMASDLREGKVVRRKGYSIEVVEDAAV